MKDFLIRKNNVAVSTYISDLNPSNITTNGALTIIDNSDNTIPGLVPYSYNIFLDNLFLAGGFGFSSYNDYKKAAYVISTYANAYSYILHELDELHNKTFNLEYSYIKSENNIDKVYNTYGCLMEYKKGDVYRKDSHTYIIELETVHPQYISNINIDVIGNSNYLSINDTAQVKVSLYSNDNLIDLEKIKETSPSIYFNDNLIDISNLRTEQNYAFFYENYDSSKYDSKDLTLTCKRHNNIIYSYTYPKAINWRYKILPFNTETLNALTEIQDLDTIYALDLYSFNDIKFDITQLEESKLSKFLAFVKNNLSKSIYIDDEINIEFTGIGYVYNNYNYYTHDYFIVEDTGIKLDFYFNGIKDNNWKYVQFNLITENGQKGYLLYQSPQRYIGKHTWTFKYRYE